jgi:hypothetical protein
LVFGEQKKVYKSYTKPEGNYLQEHTTPSDGLSVNGSSQWLSVFVELYIKRSFSPLSFSVWHMPIIIVPSSNTSTVSHCIVRREARSLTMIHPPLSQGSSTYLSHLHKKAYRKSFLIRGETFQSFPTFCIFLFTFPRSCHEPSATQPLRCPVSQRRRLILSPGLIHHV